MGIYERATLIINNMVDNDDYDEMQLLESRLDLNIAACHLKMKTWRQAITYCTMAQNIDKKNPKIYYRKAQAFLGLHNYEDADKNVTELKTLVGDKDKSYLIVKKKLMEG